MIFAAPGNSRTIISHERLRKLKGYEELNNITQGKEPPHDSTHRTVSETRSRDKKLTFDGLVYASLVYANFNT